VLTNSTLQNPRAAACQFSPVLPPPPLTIMNAAHN